MANFTRNAIKSSFLKLLNERPLSKITVKDIVSDCGVNRNTFYYYFEDIPKLIEDIIVEDAERIIQDFPSVALIEDCLNAMIDFALKHKRAVLHIYNSINRDIYEQYLWRICEHTVEKYVDTVMDGRKINKTDEDIIRQYFGCVLFGIVSGWLNKGMKEDIQLSFKRIYELQKGTVEEMMARRTLYGRRFPPRFRPLSYRVWDYLLQLLELRFILTLISSVPCVC